jgi:hypothetical protein
MAVSFPAKKQHNIHAQYGNNLLQRLPVKQRKYKHLFPLFQQISEQEYASPSSPGAFEI